MRPEDFKTELEKRIVFVHADYQTSHADRRAMKNHVHEIITKALANKVSREIEPHLTYKSDMLDKTSSFHNSHIPDEVHCVDVVFMSKENYFWMMHELGNILGHKL